MAELWSVLEFPRKPETRRIEDPNEDGRGGGGGGEGSRCSDDRRDEPREALARDGDDNGDTRPNTRNYLIGTGHCWPLRAT